MRAPPRPTTSAGVPPPSASLGRRPVTSDTSLLRDSLVSRGRTTVRPYTPMVNAEDAEFKLKEKIHRHWKDIQRMSRAFDDGTGVITQGDFKYIIEKHNLGLSEDDVNKLLLKYDLRNNNTFCYTEFLKHFVLNMRSSTEEGQLLSRRKIPSTKVTSSTGENPANVEDASTRVRACVMSHWKDMRKDFRAMDPEGEGTVSTLNFRQVMRNYNVNLSEDEFFNLMTGYDKKMNGHIAYNDFVKTVLKNQ